MADLPFLLYDIVAGLLLGLNFVLSPQRHLLMERGFRNFLNDHTLVATLLLSLFALGAYTGTVLIYGVHEKDISVPSNWFEDAEFRAFTFSSGVAIILASAVFLFLKKLTIGGTMRADSNLFLALPVILIALVSIFISGAFVDRMLDNDPERFIALILGFIFVIIYVMSIAYFLTFVDWLRSRRHSLLPTLGIAVFVVGKALNIMLILV